MYTGTPKRKKANTDTHRHRHTNSHTHIFNGKGLHSHVYTQETEGPQANVAVVYYKPEEEAGSERNPTAES